jgi:hypothetical protein
MPSCLHSASRPSLPDLNILSTSSKESLHSPGFCCSRSLVKHQDPQRDITIHCLCLSSVPYPPGVSFLMGHLPSITRSDPRRIYMAIRSSSACARSLRNAVPSTLLSGLASVSLRSDLNGMSHIQPSVTISLLVPILLAGDLI